MPKLGGLAIFAGFTVAVLIAQFLPVPRLDPYELIRLTGLLLGGCIIIVVGLIDDWLELNFSASHRPDYGLRCSNWLSDFHRIIQQSLHRPAHRALATHRHRRTQSVLVGLDD